MNTTGVPEATCPRCGAGFHCGAHDAAPCPCGSFTLAPETTRALRDTYRGCLCGACLAQLQSQPATGHDDTSQ